MRIFKQLLVGLLFAITTNAMAATIEIYNLNSGWYSQAGEHATADVRYIASENTGQRNFFTFLLDGIDTSLITGATLTVFTYDVSVTGTFTLHEITTATSTLAATSPAGTIGQATYQDLGDGLEFGSTTFGASDSQSFVTFTLNQNFLNAIQSASGIINLGGTFTTTPNNNSGYAFANSNYNTGNILTLTTTATIPEPHSSVMLFASLALVGVLGMKRRRV